jgi:DNA (cytosine-5)-methyltransferase 1
MGDSPLALDLFCGAGGASIGLKAAGYDVIGFDKYPDAIATHNHNGMPALDRDLSTATVEDWRAWRGQVDLLWGSPPCQPFSQAGRHKGRFDERDGFPWFLAAVEGVAPRVFVMENVKGLTFRKNQAYLAEIKAALEDLGYAVRYEVLNCADYGVPQKRQRLFMVGRRDGGAPSFPMRTHSKGGAELGTDPWVTMAEALGWDEPPADQRNDQSQCGEVDPSWPLLEPANTVAGRNLIPDPGANANRFNGKGKSRNDGYFVAADEAAALQAFPVWAAEEPAPTVSTTFGGVGGRKPSGGHRNLTLAEAAILQAFPNGYEFLGSKTSQFLQIGNAVPAPMAYLLAEVNR